MAEADGLHGVTGVCDLCGEFCDGNAQEANYLSCTYSACPCTIYHQECLEKFLKSNRMEKNRKTGFKCPRGSGKGTKYKETCPGRIAKSHPIHPRNEDNKKRRQEQPEVAPIAAKPPLPANGKAPVAKGKVEDIKKADAVKDARKDGDKSKATPLQTIQVTTGRTLLAMTSKPIVPVQPKPPVAPPPPTKEKLAELKAQARREIGLSPAGATVAGPSSVATGTVKDSGLSSLLTLKPLNGSTSSNVWSRPGPSSIGVVDSTLATKAKQQVAVQKPALEQTNVKLSVEPSAANSVAPGKPVNVVDIPSSSTVFNPKPTGYPSFEISGDEEELAAPKPPVKLSKRGKKKAMLADATAEASFASSDQDCSVQSEPQGSLDDLCIKHLVTKKTNVHLQQIQKLGFQQQHSVAAVQKHGIDLLSGVSWLLEGGAEDSSCPPSQLEVPEVDITDELKQLQQLQSTLGVTMEVLQQAVVDCSGDLQQAANVLASRKPALSLSRLSAVGPAEPQGNAGASPSTMQFDPVVSPPDTHLLTPSHSLSLVSEPLVSDNVSYQAPTSTSSVETLKSWLDHPDKPTTPRNGQRSQSRLFSWLGASSSTILNKECGGEATTVHKNGCYGASHVQATCEAKPWSGLAADTSLFSGSSLEYSSSRFCFFAGTQQRVPIGTARPWEAGYHPVVYTGQEVPEAALFAAAAVTSEPDHPSTAEDSDLNASLLATLMCR